MYQKDKVSKRQSDQRTNILEDKMSEDKYSNGRNVHTKTNCMKRNMKKDKPSFIKIQRAIGCVRMD